MAQDSLQSGSLDTRNAKTVAAEFRFGIVVASVASFTRLSEHELKTDCANHAAVFVANLAKARSKRQGRHTSNRQSKGGSQMLNEIINGCFVFMALVMLGCFAAGSCEISSERAERRRTEKLIREKYGRTY